MKIEKALRIAFEASKTTGLPIEEVDRDTFPLEIKVGKLIVKCNASDIKTCEHKHRELWRTDKSRKLLFDLLTRMANEYIDNVKYDDKITIIE